VYYPMTTSLQVEAHDAWLAEMQKEPAVRVGKIARSAGRKHSLSRFGAWLVSTGQRMQAGTEALAASDQASAI
jgi:hypothetical protein